MNCRQAKTDIALLIGDDLDEPSERRLEQHLALCAECRAHHRRLAESIGALHAPETVEARHESLWPALVARLPMRRADWEEGRFNGWVPAVAVAVACLAMITLSSSSPERVEYAPPRPPLAVFDQPQFPTVRTPVFTPADSPEHEALLRGLDPALIENLDQDVFSVPHRVRVPFPHRR